MGACVVLVLSLLILCKAKKQKSDEKLYNIITSLDLLREQLLDVIPSSGLQENQNKTPTSNEADEAFETTSNTENLAAEMDTNYEYLFNTLMSAFRAEKIHRHNSEDRVRRDLGALRDRLNSIIDTHENVTDFVTQTADVLSDLQDGQEELSAYLKDSSSQIKNLIGKHDCSDKISDFDQRFEAIADHIKRLDKSIRNLNLNNKSAIRPVNIALHKPSYQSSDHYHYSTADKGNDGDTNQNMLHQSCTHTKHDHNAWWEVDLEDIFYIRRVVIYNRGDCCGHRLANFFVYTSEIRGGASQVFATRTGGSVDGEVITLANDKGVIGRFLKIQLRNKACLQLCEVQVFSY